MAKMQRGQESVNMHGCGRSSAHQLATPLPPHLPVEFSTLRHSSGSKRVPL